MASKEATDSRIYVGLAGDTDPGRFVSSGLFRHCDRDGEGWHSIGAGFGTVPEVRAILTDPVTRGRLMVGTEDGIFLSEDYGDSWVRLPAPAPGIAVWSLARHPEDRDIIFAGYEPCALCETRDGGRTWREVTVAASFPDATRGPEMPKRVTGIAFDPADAGSIYASIEIGGLLRSDDGGVSWRSVIDGLYVAEDALDLHDVLADPKTAGRVTVATRVGVFRSFDGGEHWQNLRVPPLREKGSYCRRLAAQPGQPRTLIVGAGNDFDGDRGALFVSRDDGETWQARDLGVSIKSTIFALAADPGRPDGIWCATKYGEVFWSPDRGAAQAVRPLPKGAGHVFALAVG